MEMIALQAVKCTAALRTLCGRRATHLLNPPVEEEEGEEGEGGGGVHTHARSACKYNRPLSVELRAQSSSIGSSFPCSYSLPVDLLGYRKGPGIGRRRLCQVNHSPASAAALQPGLLASSLSSLALTPSALSSCHHS